MELKGFRVVTVPIALGVASARALGAAVSDALADAAVHGIVLEGSSQGFCRGMDLAALDSADESDLESSAREFAAGLCALAEAAKPTVAVVAGAALGGGLGIAAACDLVIAARGATFGLPEGLFALAPAMIAPVLRRRVTRATLLRMALTAEPVGADEARSVGLVDEVVDDAMLPARVRRVVTSLARVHPGTKRALDAALDRAREAPLAAAVRSGAQETARAAREPDARARIARFLEGGAPWQTP